MEIQHYPANKGPGGLLGLVNSGRQRRLANAEELAGLGRMSAEERSLGLQEGGEGLPPWPACPLPPLQ